MIFTKRKSILAFTTAAIAMLAMGTAAMADEAASGREIASKCGNSVVKILVVVKETETYDGQSEKRENKSEVVGTIIDPSGLTVTSLTSLTASETLFDGSEEEGYSITSEVTDLKIRLTSGKEIPAKIVLRDKDLDLAFIRPSQKLTEAVPAIDLKNSAKIDVLDPIVILSRSGKVSNRALLVSLDRIQAVLDKPRTCYLTSDGELGAPTFALDGKVLGIMLLRIMPGSSSDMRAYERIVPIVLPAEDVATAAAQAPLDAPKETPKETPKESPKENAKPVAKPTNNKGK